ncbi:uncharacterized protein LOC144453073 [Glandiceps talaboti]
MSEEVQPCKHPRSQLFIEEQSGCYEKTTTIKCQACNQAVYAYSRREVPGQKADEDIYIGDEKWFESSRGFDHKKAKKMNLKVVKVEKKALDDDDEDDEIVVEDDD